MSCSVSLKVLAVGAMALGGLALVPSEASAHDGWRRHHHRHYGYYAPRPRAYYYAPPRYVYGPPPRPRHYGYAPRPYYRY
ncbi:hypothetical protein [Plastoroseomonas arctica]|uniref:Uncharacterized protein n=1 Tax=Plastoroseomonas arctica TaxID=1509237 RepID=A0AAF1KMU5_9PROT|nr:hypothetical protein [Plastoroseomonas arctica]MBR0656846.1 hypothetical protein [Plastoroseomonas arctica]